MALTLTTYRLRRKHRVFNFEMGNARGSIRDFSVLMQVRNVRVSGQSPLACGIYTQVTLSLPIYINSFRFMFTVKGVLQKGLICKEPCQEAVTQDIGHATHDGTFSKSLFISFEDLNNNPLRPQYGVFYPSPISNTTAEKNQVQTDNLNNNRQARENVHLNCTKVRESVTELDNKPLNTDENIN